jgi:phosphatidylserine/phosphatidylglycerophosphate/cardiolipin synthase-like enzyme
MEEYGKLASDMATIEHMRVIPKLKFRFMEYCMLYENGIIYAKYLLGYSRSAYLGSQHFDWRSSARIHESGVKIDYPGSAGKMQRAFEFDWAQSTDLKQIYPKPAKAFDKP